MEFGIAIDTGEFSFRSLGFQSHCVKVLPNAKGGMKGEVSIKLSDIP